MGSALECQNEGSAMECRHTEVSNFLVGGQRLVVFVDPAGNTIVVHIFAFRVREETGFNVHDNLWGETGFCWGHGEPGCGGHLRG